MQIVDVYSGLEDTVLPIDKKMGFWVFLDFSEINEMNARVFEMYKMTPPAVDSVGFQIWE